MIGWLGKILGGGKSAAQKRSHAEQRERLKRGNPEDLQALASGTDTDPEILYYLARSDDAAIRKAVAINKATPVQASALLANDRDVDVRFALAARLIELLPDLSHEQHSQLYAYTVQALGVLAQDEVIRIRQALTSALQEHVKAPPEVVARLARDVERAVSEPILRFCVALADDDLLDILSHHPEPWVISAIAGRPVLSDGISDAVFETGDLVATGVLLNNKGASLSGSTLQKIIDKARDYPEWHHAVAMRPELSVDLARQLAGVVEEAVLSVLEKRSDFEPAMRQQVADIVKRRMSYQPAPAKGGKESAEEKLARYIATDALTPEVLHDAAIWQDWDFFFAAMGQRANIHPAIIRKMMTAGTAKPIIAACFAARLPMRLCVELQKTVGKLQPRELVYARGGTDYPMTEQDIRWQLEFFGVIPPKSGF